MLFRADRLDLDRRFRSLKKLRSSSALSVHFKSNRMAQVPVSYAPTRHVAYHTPQRLRQFIFFEALPSRVIEAGELSDAGLEFETLRNLNTAADYAAALGDAGLER